jgi:hypothetical protein
MEQAPAPRGSPHRPHGAGPNCAGAELADEEPTAKTDSCFSSASLAQAGQLGFVEPCTMASNRCAQALQMYSKIGIHKSIAGAWGEGKDWWTARGSNS